MKSKKQRKIKTTSYYEKLMAYFLLDTLEKTKSVIELIIEEIKVADGKHINIDKNELKSRNILPTKTEKILKCISNKEFSAIPPLPTEFKKRNHFIISPPYHINSKYKTDYYFKKNFNHLRTTLSRLIKLKKQNTELYSTQKGKLEFIDKEAVIKLNNSKCKLPPYRNEHYFCRAIFDYPISNPVDWEEVYEKMSHDIERGNIDKEKRKLYDIIRRLNKRIKNELKVKKLFIWRNLTITRTK